MRLERLMKLVKTKNNKSYEKFSKWLGINAPSSDKTQVSCRKDGDYSQGGATKGRL